MYSGFDGSSGTQNELAPELAPLGDQAVLARLMSEEAALEYAAVVRAAEPAWLIDVVQAYTTVAVFYEARQVDYAAAASWLCSFKPDPARAEAKSLTARRHVVPCCYDLGLDWVPIHEHTGLDRDAVIELHTSVDFTVYAIGFCPGFPYLGYLPDQLCGVPRLTTPRLRVEAGSVGLTGKQTGIYTEPRPGGWNLIGRTPRQLVDVKDGYFPLRTGDRIRFERITTAEFSESLGRRL